MTVSLLWVTLATVVAWFVPSKAGKKSYYEEEKDFHPGIDGEKRTRRLMAVTLAGLLAFTALCEVIWRHLHF